MLQDRIVCSITIPVIKTRLGKAKHHLQRSPPHCPGSEGSKKKEKKEDAGEIDPASQ